MTINGFFSLDDKIQAAGGNPAQMLRGNPARHYPFPYPPESAEGPAEQWAWVNTCAIFNQSHHTSDIHLKGPDVKRLFSDTGVNSMKASGEAGPSISSGSAQTATSSVIRSCWGSRTTSTASHSRLHGQEALRGEEREGDPPLPEGCDRPRSRRHARGWSRWRTRPRSRCPLRGIRHSAGPCAVGVTASTHIHPRFRGARAAR